MIRSMTAYGTGQAETAAGSISVEIRGVNNRYLDLGLRIPEDLRFVENRIREITSQHVKRGKLEIRINYTVNTANDINTIDEPALELIAQELAKARKYIPDLAPPAWHELPRSGNTRSGMEPDTWLSMAEQACTQALNEFTLNRQREGQRLAAAMAEIANECSLILDTVEAELPQLIQQYQEKIALRLQESLASANPDGFTAISGAELSARIAQEAGIFSMRVDIAEELTRQRSHLQELNTILTAKYDYSVRNSSNGKRMDFIFQEMNREANTLGSKSSSISVTQAAINLKLLIEQLREQAQNIE